MLENQSIFEPVNDNYMPEVALGIGRRQPDPVANHIIFSNAMPVICDQSDIGPSSTQEEQDTLELIKLKAQQRADAAKDRIRIESHDDPYKLPIRLPYVANEFYPEDSDEHMRNLNNRKGGSGLNDSTQGEFARLMAARKKIMNKRQHKKQCRGGERNLDTSEAYWGNNTWLMQKVTNSQWRDNVQAEVEADTPETHVETTTKHNQKKAFAAAREVCDKLNNGFKEANFQPEDIFPFVLELGTLDEKSIKQLVVECAINYQNMQKAKKVADAYNEALKAYNALFLTPQEVFQIFSKEGNLDDSCVRDLVFDLINIEGTESLIDVNELMDGQKALEEDADYEGYGDQDLQSDVDEYAAPKQIGSRKLNDNKYDYARSQYNDSRNGQKGVRLNTTLSVGKLHLPKITIIERMLDSFRRLGLDLSVFNEPAEDRKIA